MSIHIGILNTECKWDMEVFYDSTTRYVLHSLRFSKTRE